MVEEDNIESKKMELPIVDKKQFMRSRSKSFSLDPEIQFSLDYNKTVPPTQQKPSNWFVRSLKAIGVGCQGAYSWFKETKLGQFVQLITSNAVFRAITIVTCSAAIAGLTAIVPISIGLAIAGLVSVGIQVVVDTYQVRSVRKLEKENNLLIKNRTGKTVQDYLLKLDPKLATILKDDLYQAERDSEKKSIKERYIDQTNAKMGLKSTLKTVAQYGVDATSNVIAAATGNVVSVIKAGGSAVTLISEGVEKVTIDATRKKFKQQIDEERNKQDTPGYNNLMELRQELQKQDIQTRTLRQLMTDKSYWNMSDKEKLNKFKEIKNEIANKEEKLLSNTDNFVVRGFKTLGSIIKDIGIAHNPFSKYNVSDKLKVEGNIALTKMIEVDKKNQIERQKLKEVASFTDLLNKSDHMVDSTKPQKTKPRTQRSMSL